MEEECKQGQKMAKKSAILSLFRHETRCQILEIFFVVFLHSMKIPCSDLLMFLNYV